MATEMDSLGSAAESTAAPGGGLDADDDEENWLYGDENPGKQEEVALVDGGEDSLKSLQEPSQEFKVSNLEMAEAASQNGDEDDSDSDSDDDDVKVTIGNIKTGAPQYMGTPMNLNLKSGRPYGSSAAKLHSRGIDLDAPGSINGIPVIEADLDLFEDKPWRKPGADLSDYFNYGFNEETWKAYCEKQRRLQLGLDPILASASESKKLVQQGKVSNIEKDLENNLPKMELKADFTSPPGGRMKAGPPPNRKLAGAIDVISGYTGSIRRVEGRRRDKHGGDESAIQVLGDHGNKRPPFPAPTGPPPPIPGPPPHFLHPPPPVSSGPPPMHPPGMPPPGPLPALFPPPVVPPPSLLMPTIDGGPPPGYDNRPPPLFPYSTADSGLIGYPAISTTHTSWMNTVEKSTNSHWEYQGHRREREREHDRDRNRERDRGPTPTTSEYSSRERNYDRDYHRSRDRSRDREDRHRERRHKDKDDSKHKSSRRKQHESEEGESHRRHKHKKNKRNKEDKEVGDEGAAETEGTETKD
ncbi:pre-mRNA 3'-end-processing factor FIP1-like isoform X3 [Hemiscyllium ocellatum]|uniref:pre-mRNA 3'-end-processing factor FIP1-like isoform X3 n=1 Tax=Hemiscyllium ocellatum TaxID=170820 RepID=UPI00296763A9|nr:pre-mRNA 3'-end-processing factor FIP1-like isoform X3 [Hemiscyllium ocellatum]